MRRAGDSRGVTPLLEVRGGRKLRLRERDSGLFLLGGTLLSSKLVIREGDGGNWNLPCDWGLSTEVDRLSASWESNLHGMEMGSVGKVDNTHQYHMVCKGNLACT